MVRDLGYKSRKIGQAFSTNGLSPHTPFFGTFYILYAGDNNSVLTPQVFPSFYIPNYGGVYFRFLITTRNSIHAAPIANIITSIGNGIIAPVACAVTFC